VPVPIVRAGADPMSALAIIQQDQSDQDKAYRPNPREDPPRMARDSQIAAWPVATRLARMTADGARSDQGLEGECGATQKHREEGEDVEQLCRHRFALAHIEG
jgi:hypothetical protein